jgi:LmbE family N-acetylglucosaminyl deacetylase
LKPAQIQAAGPESARTKAIKPKLPEPVFIATAPSKPTTSAPPSTPVRKPVDPPADTEAEVPEPRSIATAIAEEQVSLPSQRRAVQQPSMVQASVLGSVVPAAVQNNGINPLQDLSFAQPRSKPAPGRIKVRVIPPGRPIEYFKADILFIHAHPDDESIDFGSLMARAARSQKRIVTLLLTDGESGLDLYPERKVGDIYPARDLTGGALSQVRVVEATRALSILGSEMYIRWGLKNRPYNTKRDEMPPDEVIRDWGGEEQLVSRLIDVLEGFRPTIVVSPDRRSEAYEHFEHEAVGQLVQIALERYKRSGNSSVKAHLVSIDPYQVDRYTGVTTVDAQLQNDSGMAYRTIQAMALREHVTQRDAAVVAVGRLSHLSHEYYKALFWNLEETLEDYLK